MPDFDRDTERDLRTGTRRIDARLDLHGMTQSAAHAALTQFMAQAAASDARTLLIITGRGKEGAGVLRANFRTWLDAMPASRHILDIRRAAPRHGGEGAFYILLKKRRDQ